MILYGISGTNGSGKDFFGTILQRDHGFLFVSVTDMLRDEAKKRGLAIERENLRMISAEWRREGGLGVLVDKAIEVYNAQGGDGAFKGLAIASMRNPGEADRVHELGGTMVWLDADPQVRYERITRGGRGRDTEDTKTYEQFLAEEQAEMQHSGDAATLSMGDVKERCDVVIMNNGSTEESFKTLLSEKLGI